MPKILSPEIVKKEIDDSHYYWVDGEYYPGVTSIIEEGAPTGWQLKQFFIRNSADEIRRKQEESLEFGSSIHAAIERLLAGEQVDLVNDFRSSRGKKTLMSFHDWFHLVSPKDFESELVVASKEMKYAGTLDFAGYINQQKANEVLGIKESEDKDEFWIVDFKTSKDVYLGYKLQVMAYKKAYEEMFGKKVDRVGILRVGTETKKGYQFVEVKEDEVSIEDFKRVYKIYLLANDGKIPQPPMIDVYPDKLQLIKK